MSLYQAKIDSVDEIRKEIFELLAEVKQESSFDIVYTEKDNLNKLFKHGCDFVVKYFDEYFKNSFEEVREITKVAVEN